MKTGKLWTKKFCNIGHRNDEKSFLSFYKIKVIVSSFPNETMCFSPQTFIVNNHQHAESSYLYLNRKKGKQARRRRDRERACVRDGE